MNQTEDDNILNVARLYFDWPVMNKIEDLEEATITEKIISPDYIHDVIYLTFPINDYNTYKNYCTQLQNT